MALGEPKDQWHKDLPHNHSKSFSFFSLVLALHFLLGFAAIGEGKLGLLA